MSLHTLVYLFLPYYTSVPPWYLLHFVLHHSIRKRVHKCASSISREWQDPWEFSGRLVYGFGKFWPKFGRRPEANSEILVHFSPCEVRIFVRPRSHSLNRQFGKRHTAGLTDIAPECSTWRLVESWFDSQLTHFLLLTLATIIIYWNCHFLFAWLCYTPRSIFHNEKVHSVKGGLYIHNVERWSLSDGITVHAMYAKSGGKNGRHNDAANRSNLSALSYLSVQIFEHQYSTSDGSLVFSNETERTALLQVSEFAHIFSY